MEPGACLGIESVTLTCETSGNGGVGRWSTAVTARTVVSLIVFAHFSNAFVEAAEHPEPYCRSDGRAVSQWLVKNLTIRLPEDVSSVGKLVEHLRAELSVPISWIPVREEEPLRKEAEPGRLEDLLRSVADQHPEYRCEVRSGRLILRSEAEIFDRAVEGVDVVDRYRFRALNDYIEHLRAMGDGFETWIYPLVGSNLDHPLFQEKVTLAPQGSLLDHLVQLLGKLPTTYFTIPVPGEVSRTIYISATD